MDFKSRVCLTLIGQVNTFNKEHPNYNLVVAIDEASGHQVTYHLRLTSKLVNESIILIYDVSIYENVNYEVMTSISDIHNQLQEQL